VSYADKRLNDLALIIVDMQNDFVRVGAPLEVPDARQTIDPHKQLLAAFRLRKLPVIYTKFISMPEEYPLIRCGIGHLSAGLRPNAVGRGMSAIIRMLARSSSALR
jgi:nicotinamidase-related amidase